MKSTTIALILLFGILHGSTFAAESDPKPQKKNEPWENNRLTSEQPFPARVVGFQSSWVEYLLLLEEVDADVQRYCFVRIDHSGPPRYALTTKEESVKLASWTMIDPSVLVSDFSIDGKLFKLGKKFGEEDLLRSSIAKTNKQNKS